MTTNKTLSEEEWRSAVKAKIKWYSDVEDIDLTCEEINKITDEAEKFLDDKIKKNRHNTPIGEIRLSFVEEMSLFDFGYWFQQQCPEKAKDKLNDKRKF